MASSSTPILDSGVLPRRIRKTKWGNVVTGFLAGIVPGVLLVVVGRQANTRMNPGLDLLSFFCVLMFAVFLHEMAHLSMGWAVGFRFSSIRTWPLSLRMEHGLLKVQFRLEMAAMGYAEMHVDRLQRLRRRMFFYVAAGPAANILSVPTAVLIFNNGFPALGNTWVATPVAQFAFISLLLGVLSLIPHQSFLMTDGARIRILLCSHDHCRRWLGVCAVGSLRDKGTRARDWKRTWLSSAASVHDASVDDFSGNLLSYISANDRKETGTAAAYLERCLELTPILPLSIRDILAQEAAVFTAWFQHDANNADKWVAQLRKPDSMQHLVKIRLDVALRFAHGEYEGAESAWRQGLAFIEKATAGSSRELIRATWLEWQAEMIERKAQQISILGGAETRR